MKILACGCSFTAGQELPDAMNTYEISKYAYPSLLANILGGEVKNISLSGGSNARIFRKVIDEVTKNSYDLVLCGWTTDERLDLQFDGKDVPSTPGSRSFQEFPWLRSYYAVHCEPATDTQTWMAQILGLQSYLKSIDQKYIFVSLWPLNNRQRNWYPHLVEKVDKKYFLGWPDLGMVDFQGDCPKGPRGHPLELGHQRIANKIYEHIRYLGWFS